VAWGGGGGRRYACRGGFGGVNLGRRVPRGVFFSSLREYSFFF